MWVTVGRNLLFREGYLIPRGGLEMLFLEILPTPETYEERIVPTLGASPIP